ncbi:peptide/nickel transport system ATP-binding protein [Streptacidiphilus jiangxiensis]|uniref:Peptide/nickel transport system ATP-binding protein n=1 Tax=Streptacidiphilus jiangxiensis TaxID=235985 RepID=A0A1H7X899_STRJI|nr:peptide/nickel transport system ATP-binding protein [Streptacidiphilus jiangxiensis]
MRGGRLEEHGPVDEVIHTPSSPYARSLTDAVPRLAHA